MDQFYVFDVYSFVMVIFQSLTPTYTIVFLDSLTIPAPSLTSLFHRVSTPSNASWNILGTISQT